MRKKLEYPLKALSITFDRPTGIWIARLKDHMEAQSISEIVRQAWHFYESIKEDQKISGLFSICQGDGNWLDQFRDEDVSLQKIIKRINLTLPKRIVEELEKFSVETGIEKNKIIKLVIKNMHAGLMNQVSGNLFYSEIGNMERPCFFLDFLPRHMSPETAAISEPAW